jgi:hypothetical protein
MALYAYCLIHQSTPCELEALAGVEDSLPRLIACDEFSVVVSDCAGERVAVGRENVFAHERVIHHVLRQTTPLPFRFGTLVNPGRLEAYLNSNRAALLKGLERVRDAVEMSVKIIWDRETFSRPDFGAEDEDKAQADEPRGLGKGAAYLAAKRREILGDELLKERAGELAEWLAARVDEVVIEQSVEVRPMQTLCLRAAYLVQRSRLEEYQTRIEEARVQRDGLRFLTSGPWPPYSFSNINP